MPAKLIYQENFVYSDGAIREMILWQLPRKNSIRPYSLKYRLYYGLVDGTCIVRYDNETGKGDQEEPYPFTDVETLLADFMADIEKAREG